MQSRLMLPPSISKLENLQTLIIGTSVASKPDILFPPEIWSMPRLRHIMAGQLRLSSPIPFAILENLQTISRVVDVHFTSEVIAMIPNLLKLKVLYNVTMPLTWQKLGLDNLVLFEKLETLDIWFWFTTFFLDVRREPPLPETFTFPQKLKKLSLNGCGLEWKDLTKVGSLPNLQVLKLRDEALVGEEWEPVEGEFLRLKVLLMENLQLKYWQAENIHFPCLEHLEIRHCSRLTEIPPGIGEIPTLELIEVHFSELAAKSALKIREEQQSLGDEVLQVHVYSGLPDRFRKKKARRMPLNREGSSSKRPR